MSKLHVGFIGVGRMGAPMVTRLLSAGHRVTAFDVNGENLARAVANGAQPAGSASEVGSAAATVFISLPTPDIVQQVVLGDSGIIRGNRVRTLVDLSTTGPRVAAAIAAELAASGRVVMVDAPVSGGVAGAVNGTLAVMVSGPRATFEEMVKLLETFGKVFFCGEGPGLAQTLKLANNLLAAAALVVTSEAMAMGVKAGLDPQVMLKVINVSSGRNTATMDKFPRAVLPGTFDFGFATGLSYKDVRLCVDEAEAMGVPMVVGAAVRQMLAVTNATFGPEADFTHVAKVLEQWANVEIRNPAPGHRRV
jgi:3-hydroxyisobutyrate dehydrogenase-like beta-hydroxyacid dehydrogenase